MQRLCPKGDGLVGLSEVIGEHASVTRQFAVYTLDVAHEVGELPGHIEVERFHLAAQRTSQRLHTRLRAFQGRVEVAVELGFSRIGGTTALARPISDDERIMSARYLSAEIVGQLHEYCCQREATVHGGSGATADVVEVAG